MENTIYIVIKRDASIWFFICYS